MMLRRVLLTMGAAGALIAAGPALAQSADQSMRCFLASNFFGKAEKDPVKKQVAIAAFFFYFGRLDAQLSPSQFKAQALTQGKTLNQQNAGQIMTVCAQQVQAKQHALQALGPSASQARPAK